MIEVRTEALVTYNCILTDEDEEMVRNYAEENDVSIEEAVNILWDDAEINIYMGEQIESDCQTQLVEVIEE
ncbi:MAG: hypothetical protein WCO84_01005 [bacterium]